MNNTLFTAVSMFAVWATLASIEYGHGDHFVASISIVLSLLMAAIAALEVLGGVADE